MNAIGNRLKSKIRAFLLFTVGAGLRGFRPRRPVKRGERILIHVGCGEFDDPRYINIDSRPGWHVDHVADIVSLPELFGPEYADLIYACHILEHISHQKAAGVLKGLLKILKPGGVLRLSVPDFGAIAAIYAESGRIRDIMEPLMGGQGYAENFHRMIFDEKYLRELLSEAGFRHTRPWKPGEASEHAFGDWSGRLYPANGKQWKISLNLEAVK